MTEPEIQVDKIPWQNRKEFGFLRALRLTRQEIIFHPVRFFSKVSPEGGLVDSLIFALIMACILALLALAFSWFYFCWALEMRDVTPLIYFIAYIVLLLGESMRLLITAGIFHLGFLIAGARQGFKATFKVVAYTSAVEPFALLVCFLAFSFQFVIPVLPDLLSKKIVAIVCFFLMAGGFLLFWLYPLVLYFIGLKRFHNLGVIRALCGFIFPIALSIGAFMLLPKHSPRRVCPLRLPQAMQQGDNNAQDTKTITEKLPEAK